MRRQGTALKTFFKRHGWWVLPGMLACIVYLNSVKAEFFWDDRTFILDNPNIKTLKKAVLIFDPGYWKTVHEGMGGLYRPLRELSFALDYAIWSKEPAGYRLTNILLHASDSVLVAVTARMLFQSPAGGLAAGALFALHPIHTENINFIKNRADILCTMFVLLSFLFWKKEKIIYSALFYLLSLFSKESGAAFPLILLAHILLLEPRPGRKQKLLSLLPHFLLLAGFFLISGSIPSLASKDPELVSLFSSIPAPFRIFSTGREYLRLLFFPKELCVDRGLPLILSLIEKKALFFYIIFVLSFFLTSRLRESRKTWFAALWMLLALAPVSNILPIEGRAIAEQRLYLPSAGWALFVAGIFLSFTETRKPLLKKTAEISVVILALFFFSRTFIQNRLYLDPVKLWEKSIALYPVHARAYVNLGVTYQMKNELEKARAAFEKALEIEPNSGLALNNLGSLFQKKGEDDKAIEAFMKAIEISPEDSRFHINLGSTYKDQKKYSLAFETFKKALEINPHSSEAYYNLGLLYAERDEGSKALEHFRKCLDLDPDSDRAYYNMGIIYDKENKPGEALSSFVKALRISPDNSNARNNLANLYSKTGARDKAIEEYKKLI